MPPKKKIPAPIDRPLSRAYLREFTGWSTAYPPGISDPTSLRIMENVQIQRDGSARVRPGLRYISYDADGLGLEEPIVGTHETFFLADGTKAYLFATRSDDGRVVFKMYDGTVVRSLVDDFDIPQGEETLAFSEATTYVKYVQIDNKIFALSNAGETMRYFTVGVHKTAKVLSSVTRPNWDVSDKLTVMHPEAAWITSAAPSGLRTNRVKSPAMDGVKAWSAVAATTVFERSDTIAQTGVWSGRLSTKPTKTNLCHQPLGNAGSSGVGDWEEGMGADNLSVSGGLVRVDLPAIPDTGGSQFVSAHRTWRVSSPKMDVQAGQSYQAAFDIGSTTNVRRGWVGYTFYTAAGAAIGQERERSVSLDPGRNTAAAVSAPSGAKGCRVRIYAETQENAFGRFTFENVWFGLASESSAYFDGGSGANHFWEGATNDSVSVYHPPLTAEVYTEVTSLSDTDWAASLYHHAGATVRTVELRIEWLQAVGTVGSPATNSSADSVSAWTRLTTTANAPAGAVRAYMRVKIPLVARGEFHYIDSAMFEEGTSAGSYFDGSSTDSGTLDHRWTGEDHNSTSTKATYSAPVSIPTPETKTANTLISSTAADNDFNFGFFYTFNTEIGENAASQVTVVRAQRAWQAWQWFTPNAAGEPSSTSTADPGLCADQLVAVMPQAVWDQALAEGATRWNLYMFTWSDQDPVPVEAIRISSREVSSTLLYGGNGWARATPQMVDAGSSSALLPQEATRRDYTEPSRAAQGLVAADRMILVNDPTNSAMIRWTSNQQGSYTDFSASKGGGIKTLTSGELMIPASVKLWQNPQSADTITILCFGVDGYSTGYYMAPAQVASQSEATNVMGFEETTATPGTVSPFGCEVVNNALYHPLDEQLMKSTATNYNINHKTVTEQISDVWTGLDDKHLIVSANHDNRIYFLVNNPQGITLPEGCRGNEVWVFDAAAENGHWSRWTTPGHSLRKIEQGGVVVMSLVHPTGLFYFDELYDRDDVVDPDTREVGQDFISWRLETNTQGANRAHDAWAHLQQANVTFGFPAGVIRYGVRGLDIHGKRVDLNKLFRVTGDTTGLSPLAWDQEDFLLVRRDLKEWFFYAESIVDEFGAKVHSFGQVNLVQYRYTPSTVNTGYEFGSIETFEYGRAEYVSTTQTTDNGVPMPYVDTARP